MATTISFGIQKGGAGKTTATAISSYLLSQDYKVLSVDFDSQGNLTSFLSQRNIYDFTDHNILQALKEKNPHPYIYEISDTLHLLPAEDYLSILPRYLYREYKGHPSYLLNETLNLVEDQYDYILIDLPPNLGDHTVNGLTASDYAVILLQSEPFCYDALTRYIEFLEGVRDNTNPNLLFAGILTSMLDSRATIDTSILNQAKAEYEDAVFDSIIRRRAKIKEFTISGITNKTKQDRDALEPYIQFVEELKKRCQN